ncbi:MAG: bifunctional 2-polyprenyl-6-hydroxyphenol methylase/3-demethylubiquinol 3-O-methyltransferase UbiG [Sphingobium sp.]
MASEAGTTIDRREAEHFGALATDWWDPHGSSAMLHKLNPVRLRFIRNAINRHWQSDARDMRPLSGKSALDAGCGAGLLCEPLSRLGAAVTGIDAAPENIDAARSHAGLGGLPIDYRCCGVEDLPMEARFDLITAMEVIEHVTDPALFLQRLAKALAPDGLMILSTPNRTPLSRLAMITLGEGLRIIPRGTHDWNRFLTPDELVELLADAGLRIIDQRGISFDPGKGMVLSDRDALNYILSIRHAG